MSETRQIVEKLDDVIRTMAVDVGKISITQAIIQTKQDSTYTTVGRIEEKVNKINSRVDSLESTRDENIGKSKRSATIKKGIAWGLGITCSVAGLIFGIMRVLQ